MEYKELKSFDFISAEEEKCNMETLIKLLPNFQYDTHSRRMIEEGMLQRATIDDDLGLDAHKRRVFEVDYVDETTDDAFDEFKTVIYNYHFNTHCIKYLGNHTTSSVAKSYPKDYCLLDLMDYDNYMENSLPCGAKLIRYLRRLPEFPLAELEQAVSIRSKGNKHLVLITRNPIDMLMASTNQSFSSCIGLESDYEDCYYLALPSFFIDPNRYMICKLSRKQATDNYDVLQDGRHILKHIRYASRTFCIHGRHENKSGENHHFLAELYPNHNALGLMQDLFKTLYEKELYSVTRIERSKYEAPDLTHENGQIAYPYTDDHYFDRSSHYWRGGGSGSTFDGEYDHSYGFADGCKNGGFGERCHDYDDEW